MCLLAKLTLICVFPLCYSHYTHDTMCLLTPRCSLLLARQVCTSADSSMYPDSKSGVSEAIKDALVTEFNVPPEVFQPPTTALPGALPGALSGALPGALSGALIDRSTN